MYFDLCSSDLYFFYDIIFWLCIRPISMDKDSCFSILRMRMSLLYLLSLPADKFVKKDFASKFSFLVFKKKMIGKIVSYSFTEFVKILERVSISPSKQSCWTLIDLILIHVAACNRKLGCSVDQRKLIESRFFKRLVEFSSRLIFIRNLSIFCQYLMTLKESSLKEWSWITLTGNSICCMNNLILIVQ